MSTPTQSIYLVIKRNERIKHPVHDFRREVNLDDMYSK